MLPEARAYDCASVIPYDMTHHLLLPGKFISTQLNFIDNIAAQRLD